jgi:hypothetical protein
MFNRISFGGSFSKYFEKNVSDLTWREFFLLFILISFTVLLGIHPNFVLDGTHYSVSNLIYSSTLPCNTMSYSTMINKNNNELNPNSRHIKYKLYENGKFASQERMP